MYKLALIVFDLDDTLIAIKRHESRLGNSLKEDVKKIGIAYGVPANILNEVKNRTALLFNSIIGYLEEEKGYEEDWVKSARNELNKLLHEHESLEHETSQLRDGVIESLEILKKRGYKLGVLTNTSRSEWNKISSKHKIGKYFGKLTMTRDDVKRIKPDTEGIQKLLEISNEKKFVVIGDLDYDSLVANKAGGDFILFDTKRYTQKQIETLDSIAVVSSHREIPALIESLYSN